MIKLGFSTGTLYKFNTAKQSLKIFRDLECTCVELGFVKPESFAQLSEITKEDLADFDYVSLHAPKFGYQNNPESEEILKKIKQFSNNVRKLNLVVFHPDEVRDFLVLEKSGLPIGIENMDNRKDSFQGWREIKEILDTHPNFGLVLDVNHIYGNDPSMESIKDFYRELGSKISEIHLSGYDGSHKPIFETKQLGILKSIQGTNIPIIVESVLSPDNIMKEKNYILENLS